MKMINRLQRVTEGFAELFGKPIGADDMEARPNIGYSRRRFPLRRADGTARS